MIPFYKFFSREDAQFKTPIGALILHWISVVIWISVTPNTSEGYGFVIGVFIYGQLVIGGESNVLYRVCPLTGEPVCMGVATFWIRPTYERGTRKTVADRQKVIWSPVLLTNRYFRWLAAVGFTSVNFLVLVLAARSAGNPPPWAWPVTVGAIFLFGAVYWVVIRVIEKYSNESSLVEIRIAKAGAPTNPQDSAALQQAIVEGNSRIVAYEVLIS